MFVSLFTSNPNDYTLHENILSSTVIKGDEQCPAFNTASKAKCF